MATTARTNQEILARIKAVEGNDWMGTQCSDLLLRLPLEDAEPHLRANHGATPETWAAAQSTTLPPLEQVKDYLPFAWDKANNCRGLSAARSLDHMRAWFWLAGVEEKSIETVFDTYDHYGKKQLVAASIALDFDWRAHDDGRWADDELGGGEGKEFIEREAAHAAELAKLLRVPA